MVTSVEQKPVMLMIEHLEDNPWQPRTKIDQGKLKSLANSIQEYGFTGYVEARPHPTRPGAYQLVFGHRRVQAAALAGLRQVPVVVRNHTDKDMATLAMYENHTQETMSYWDEGMVFRRLMAEHGYSIRELARMFDVSRGYITNRMIVTDLPEGSALREAARTGQTDMTTIMTLASLSKVMDQDEITGLLNAAARKDINADQLKQIRQALKTSADQVVLTDEGKAIHTVTAFDQQRLLEEKRAADKAAAEARYAAYLDSQRVQRPGDFPKDTLTVAEVEMPAADPVADPVEAPVFRLNPMQRVETTPREWALRAIEQLQDNHRFLADKLAKADFAELTDAEREEFKTWRGNLIALLEGVL